MSFAGMRLADGMSKAAVAFLAKQLAAENTHSGKSACSSMSWRICVTPCEGNFAKGFHAVFSHKMLTRAAIVADKLSGAGVDVFCIAPGAIDTPMFQASSLNHLSDSQRADFIGKMGQARLIPPKEIAEQIFFLCRSVLVSCSLQCVLPDWCLIFFLAQTAVRQKMSAAFGI